MAESTTISDDPTIQEHQRPPDVSQGTPTADSVLTSATISTANWEQDFPRFFGKTLVHPGRKASIEQLYKELHFSMAFLYHAPAIDKIEAANDLTFTDAINQIIAYGSVPPADLIDNFLDPIDPGPLLSDCLRVYLLEQFVRETCLAEEKFGEPLVDISKFSGIDFLAYCRRGRRKKTEGYKNYETSFEEAAEAYVKKKIHQLRANAGPKEVLSLPNPMEGPTTFYTRVLNIDDRSHSFHSSQDTTPVKQPVRTPAGHNPSVQNDGNTQPATPKPVDTPHPSPPHRFAAAFEAIHGTTATSTSTIPQGTSNENPFNTVTRFTGKAKHQISDDDEDSLSSQRDYTDERGQPKLVKRTLALPKHLKFLPEDFNKFKRNFDVWCARNDCHYLVDRVFQKYYLDDKNTALLKYKDPATEHPLRLHPKQLALDVRVLHGWLLDALAGTDASHFTDVPGVIDGIPVYFALVNEYLSAGNRENRRSALESLLQRTYRANESLSKFVSTYRTTVNRYNLEAEFECDRKSDKAQRSDLIRLLREGDDTEVRNIARVASARADCNTMGSLCAYILAEATSLDAIASNDARLRSRSGRRQVNFSGIEEGVSKSEMVQVFKAAVQDELNLTDTEYKNLPPDVRAKYRKARQLARMWLRNSDSKKETGNDASAKPPVQQGNSILPKQYSGRGNPSPPLQQGTKNNKAHANIAHAENSDEYDEDYGWDEEDTTSDLEESPFTEANLHVLLASSYDPTTGESYSCNMVQTTSSHVANLAITTKKPYAICDNGAQVCILGGAQHAWHIETTDNFRTITITGAIPSIMRKPALSVVTAVTKVLLRDGSYALLRAHECVLNPDTNVTLLSEFQLREGGCVLDSVPLNHRTSFDSNTFGTQSLQPKPGIFIPLHTRAALMVIDLLPPSEDDLLTLPRYEITNSEPWKPSDHYNNSLHDIYRIHAALLSKTITTLTTFVPCTPHLDVQATLSSTTAVPLHRFAPLDPFEAFWTYFDPNSMRFDFRHFQEFIGRQFRGGTNDMQVFLSLLDDADDHSNKTVAPTVVDKDELQNDTNRHPILDDQLCAPDHERANELADRSFRFKAKYSFEDIDKTRQYLGWATPQIIRETLKRTTQLAKAITRYPMYRHLKARFPFMNVKRIREVVSTDTIFMNVKSFDGYEGAQIFYGLTSHVINVYGLRSKDMAKYAFQDFITDEGAPWAFRMDGSQEQSSKHVLDLCRDLHIKITYSEPNYQNQNPVESRAIKSLKHKVETLLNRSNAPPRAHFHACRYIAELHNVTADESLRYAIPYTVRHGETVDISCYLNFKFYDKIYYMLPRSSFPDTREAPGYWLGVAKDVGDFLTYEILTDDTQRIIIRSVVRPYEKNSKNNRLQFSPELDPDVAQAPSPFPLLFSNSPLELRRDLFQHRRNPLPLSKRPNKSLNDSNFVAVKRVFPHEEEKEDTTGDQTRTPNDTDIPVYTSQELPSTEDIIPIGHLDNEVRTTTPEVKQDTTYIVARTDKPRRRRPHKARNNQSNNVVATRKSSRLKRRNIRLVNTILAQNIMDSLPKEPRRFTHSLAKLKQHHLDYVTFNTYSQDVLDYIANPKGSTIADVISHRGTTSHNTDVLVLWKNGGTSWHSVDTIRIDCPYAICHYVNKHNLHLHKAFQWCHLTEANTATFCALNATFDSAKPPKQRGSFSPRFKFGIEIPRNVRHALELDKRNGNTLWEDAINAEMSQINGHTTFIQAGGDVDLTEYTLIRYHIIFDVKFDLRRKARLVANGNGTEPTLEDVYSGVVAQDTIRIAFAIAAINGLLVCAGDVGNAFLYALTNEKVYVIAGPEFGALAGTPMIIHKGLYGLRTSSARFHEHLAATFRELGFIPSRYDNDLWIRDRGEYYELIATYVDDVLVFSKDPMETLKVLQDKYTMKGVGEPEYYLGGNVVNLGPEWEKYGIKTALSAETYIKNSLDKLETMLQTYFSPSPTPMAENCHPELDESELLDKKGASQYRSLIGCANWIVTLGRIDIQYAVMALARFSMSPRHGHMKAMKRVFGYLKRHPQGRILCDPNPPDHEKYGYVHSPKWKEFYPEVTEPVPHNCPSPKGKAVFLTAYVDADHAHDVVTRRSVTGVLVLLNGMIIRSYSKRQTTVESSTYGSELVAARIAVDIIYELRMALRVLGVPLGGPALLLGDNKAVVINGTVPSSTIKKKHCSINYHRVREAIACRTINFVHIPTEDNIADILTKPVSKGVFQRHMKRTIFRDSPDLEVVKGVRKLSNQNQDDTCIGVPKNKKDDEYFVKLQDEPGSNNAVEGVMQACHVMISDDIGPGISSSAWDNYFLSVASHKITDSRIMSDFQDWLHWVYEATCSVREQGYPVVELHRRSIVWLCVPALVHNQAFKKFPHLYNYKDDYPEELMSSWSGNCFNPRMPLPIPQRNNCIMELGPTLEEEVKLCEGPRVAVAYCCRDEHHNEQISPWHEGSPPPGFYGYVYVDLVDVLPRYDKMAYKDRKVYDVLDIDTFSKYIRARKNYFLMRPSKRRHVAIMHNGPYDFGDGKWNGPEEKFYIDYLDPDDYAAEDDRYT